MSEERQVVQSVVVDTTPELAFAALATTGELREWCADQAWTEPRPGGRFALHWNSGYHAEGTFLEFDPPRRATVSWRGTGEPGETRLEFVVAPRESGVEVTLRHSGFGSGVEWDEAVGESQKGWTQGLENLKSTLETGVDLRVARQPFLGITLDLLTPERAAREGIAVERGIYVTGTVEGSGAEAAGLGNGDVIVALSGSPTPGFAELTEILRARQAGDQLEAEVVHGQERRTVSIILGTRPQPELPESAEKLAMKLAERHQKLDAELQQVLSGLSDEESAQCPQEGEWSVQQVLAHLSDGERSFHTVLVNLAVNGWMDADPVYPNDIPGRIEAILALTPTLQGLVDRLLADERETVEIVRRLPADTLAHKARFRTIAQYVLYGPDHTQEHIEQIRQAIETVCGN
jgi:uncharacterized protein YndB with AHSA1/START domain